MINTSGSYGVLTGNFTGSGRTDIIRWSDTPGENQLYVSNGDGSFTQNTVFNITDQNLFKSDGCYSSIAMDFNGDGLTDILRITNTYSSTPGGTCGTPVNLLYVNNGDGTFRQVDISSSGIDFTQTSAVTTDYYACDSENNPGCIKNSGYPPGEYAGTSRQPGKNFHLIDVNNDGILDVVTTIAPGFPRTNPAPADTTLCANQICTQIFLGQANGGFVAVPAANTNVSHRSLYGDPQPRTTRYVPYVADIDGDGMMDLAVPSGVWISQGDGNFVRNADFQKASGCQYPIDYKGDGRSGCLLSYGDNTQNALLISDGTGQPLYASGFDFQRAGRELVTYNWVGSQQFQTAGIVIADINGDGRGDILRWKDDPSQNALYLSNGDGSFRQAADFNIQSQLQKSDGSTNMVTGDFTGHGNTEILRISTSGNTLFVKSDPTPPDQLQTVVSGAGLSSALTWVPLSNSASGSLGKRYSSDTGTGAAAKYPVIDLSVPNYVVATVTSDTGAGGKLVTEYSYAGLKAAYNGIGWLGFREIRRQSQRPDGGVVTIATQYLQDGNYTGMAAQTQTWLGSLNASNAQVVSSTSNTYCDKTAAAGADGSASAGAPCAVSPQQILRPYLLRSVENGNDLDGSVLPTVTTTNTFNNSGDPTQIVITTQGTSLGVAQQSSKTTSNVYLADNTAGDNWILGRLQKATVSSSVPNLLGSVSASAGSAPYASAIQGTGPVPPPAPPPSPPAANINAGLLQAIQLLLLGD